MFRIKVPASTANLGPGFDSLGMALNLTNTFEVKKAKEMSFSCLGEGQKELMHQEDNFFFRSYRQVFANNQLKAYPLQVTVKSKIPPSRGLGSSAAAIIAGLMTASHLLAKPLTKEELIKEAVALEGHADNIMPSLLGGLILSYINSKGDLDYRSLPLPKLRIIVAVPSFTLATIMAREVLPNQLSLKDALFNLQHMGLLIDALYRKDYSTLLEAMQDRMHQPYREKLVPGFRKVLQNAMMAGALGIALSGSGPSILAFAKEREREIGEAMVVAFQEAGLEARYLLTTPCKKGAILLE